MRKEGSQPKRQGGISLRPETWEAVDRLAQAAGVPRNRVMETAVEEHVKRVLKVPENGRMPHKVEESIWREADDADDE